MTPLIPGASRLLDRSPRTTRPRIGFLFVGSLLRVELPPDGSLPRRPCRAHKAGAPAKGGFRKAALKAASSHQLAHPKTLSSVSFSPSGSPVGGARLRLPGVQARDATNPGPRRGRDPKECPENMMQMRPEDSPRGRGLARVADGAALVPRIPELTLSGSARRDGGDHAAEPERHHAPVVERHERAVAALLDE